MTRTLIGMGVGATLALTWIAAGFWAFALVLIAMAIGAGVGHVMDGKLDIHLLTDAFRSKHSSS